MSLRILNAAEVRQALPMSDAIAGMKVAFAQLAQGQADMPLRSRIAVPEQNGTVIFMPAYLKQTADLAIKVVSVFPQNSAHGRPVIYGVVLVMDAATGQPLALLEGGALTAIRTGAASGAATDLLARPDATVLALLGSGVQARTQLEAVCAVRAIGEVRVYSLNRHRAQAFADSVAGAGLIPLAVRVVDSPQTAVKDADIICAATSSFSPVFAGHDVKPGTHINAIGSYMPEMQEVDVVTIQRSLLVVDSRTAVLAEAGDLIIPLRAGLISEDHIYAELGEIAAGLKSGRSHPEQITCFKSVGVAVQDAVAARIALEGAIAHNLGAVVNL
jgi:alanine dehydrogenase